MPYPNEHSARMIDPEKFEQDSFRRKNIAPGVDIILGKLKGETSMMTQTYRFDSKKFTPDEAKKWLTEHDIKNIGFEAALSDNQNMSETGWFEAFEAGDYKAKGSYNKTDIDNMVEIVKSKAHIAPVIVGHHDTDDPRNAELTDGLVIDAKRQNNKFLVRADITNPKVKQWWEDNRLLTWSVSIYDNFKGTGKRALRHLAALGKTPPEVKGLQYKPTFDEDEKNGKFVTIEFAERGNNQMTLEEAMAKIAALEKELADLKAKKEAGAQFAEEKKTLDAQIVSLTTERDAALAKIAEAAKEKKTAQFAEIEAEVQKAHKERGLPATHGDHMRTVLAAERGLLTPTGTVEFAEGKSAKLSEAMIELAKVKLVPLEDEGKKADKTTADFTEGDMTGKQTERVKMARELQAQKKAEGREISFAEATTEIYTTHPGLFPDWQ